MSVFGRNGGMGLVQVISRIGAALAPFIVEIDRIHPMLPFSIMGGMTFIAAFLCWFLPETKGKATLEVFGDEGMFSRETVNGNIR